MVKLTKTSTRELRESARRIVESSRREQRLEAQITDPVVIGKIAAILRPDLNAPRKRHPARSNRLSPRSIIPTLTGGINDRTRPEC